MRNVYYILSFLILFSYKNIHAQHIIDDSICSHRKYRHIIIDESDKYFPNNLLISDTFQYLYRPDFGCRYLDEDYLLCQIHQINDTLKVEDMPSLGITIETENLRILDINVRIIDIYKARLNPFHFTLFGEELFKEEYSGERNYGLLNYVSYVDSCIQDTTTKYLHLFLLVSKDEISLISSIEGKPVSIFCNINKIFDIQTYYSDILYFEPFFNLDEFYSLPEWADLLHQRIEDVIKKIMNNK